MSPAALIVGDTLADTLVQPLDEALRAASFLTRVMPPCRLAEITITAESDTCCIDGERIDVVVFRASPTLFVAPEFGEDDAGFAASELRAVWAHILSLPSVVAINQAHVDTWFATSEWNFWRRQLAQPEPTVAPRCIGRPYNGGHWVKWTGGISPLPPIEAAERLGVASVAPGELRHNLVCAGEIIGSDDEMLATVAIRLLNSGIALADLITNTKNQIVSLTTLPALTVEESSVIAPRLARWIHAAINR